LSFTNRSTNNCAPQKEKKTNNYFLALLIINQPQYFML
jgi:hypothetical protein